MNFLCLWIKARDRFREINRMKIINRWCRSRSFHIFLVSLILCISSPITIGASNFVRVVLGGGASIEVPRNWKTRSENNLITLDSYVEAKGVRQIESSLNFAANLYDDNGKTIALVNTRFYPDNKMTQADARQYLPEDFRKLNAEFRESVEARLNANGMRVKDWYGVKVQTINGLYVVMHEYNYLNSSSGGAVRVRGLRVWRSPNSFAVTLSYD